MKYPKRYDEARSHEDGDDDNDGHGHHVVAGPGGRLLLHLGGLVTGTIHLVCKEQQLDLGSLLPSLLFHVIRSTISIFSAFNSFGLLKSIGTLFGL